MLRNVLIISTSPNKGGSSAKIAKEFARGVRASLFLIRKTTDRKVVEWQVMKT